MEVQAQARWVRAAPRKVKLVADTLKGLPVSEALTLCKFIPKAAAKDLAKVIRSAQANAEHNYSLEKDDLFLKDLRVESGVTMKRAQHRAMGRYFSIFKRTSHITAVVEDRPGAIRRPAPPVPRAPQPAGSGPQVSAPETRPSAPAPAAPPAAPAESRKGKAQPPREGTSKQPAARKEKDAGGNTPQKKGGKKG